jgi:hypothetical protein
MKALAQVVGLIFGLVVAIWSVICTWIAFAGGQMPILPVHFTGVNLLRGGVWLFIVDPIVVGIARLVIGIPLVILGSAAERVGSTGRGGSAVGGALAVLLLLAAGGAVGFGIAHHYTHQSAAPKVSEAPNLRAHLTQDVPLGEPQLFYPAGTLVEIQCADGQNSSRYIAWNGKSAFWVSASELDAKITGSLDVPCFQWESLHSNIHVYGN